MIIQLDEEIIRELIIKSKDKYVIKINKTSLVKDVVKMIEKLTEGDNLETRIKKIDEIIYQLKGIQSDLNKQINKIR